MNRRLFALAAAAVFAATLQARALSLEEGFKNPPRDARPHTWYHMMNGNVTKEGITADFEALARAGVGGVQMFDAGCAVPPGDISFNTPEWFDVFRHAQAEAKRLGLEICVPNCSGWSSSGGPWNPPANGMKEFVFTETAVKGPSKFSGVLPRTSKDNGFYADIAVIAYPTPKPGAKISNFDSKAGKKRNMAGLRPNRDGDDYVSRTKDVFSPEQKIAKTKEIDLTAKMGKDGALEWDVPPGNWTILRAGFRFNGRRNHPASDKGSGPEVDKLSAEAMDFHFSQYVARLCKALGVDKTTDNTLGFNNILVDSYEVGCQTWTQGLEKTFERRFGYSLVPYLPALAGRVVGSTGETERFFEDFRTLLGELFAKNYAGRLAELCHENGLKLSVEPYGNCIVDDLEYGEAVDIPMSEFWTHNHDPGNAKLVSSLAHVWGRRYAGAESFTATVLPRFGRWLDTPGSIRRLNDLAFAKGVNRIIYHRFTHQPWADADYAAPGMTMGRWGMHFDRKNTWWSNVGPWLKYQARCQWMLQEGKPCSDILRWTGEKTPNDNRWWGVGAPAGYDWDVAATKAVRDLKVLNGRIVSPGGAEYALLALPETDTMSEEMLECIGALVEKGARVCGKTRPSRHSGLSGGPDGDSRVKALAAKTWAKGVMPCRIPEALKKLGLAPDFSHDAKGAEISWIHRRSDAADWYFVAAGDVSGKGRTEFNAYFRVSGRVPELWDAETGEMCDAPVWRETGGRTMVRLSLARLSSVFVVFRRPSAGVKHFTSFKATLLPQAPVAAAQGPVAVKKALFGTLKRSGAAEEESGEFEPGAVDVTARVASLVASGRAFKATMDDLGCPDPAFGKVKFLRVWYSAGGGEERVEDFNERTSVALIRPRAESIAPQVGWSGGKIVAWRNCRVNVTASDGTADDMELKPRPAVEIGGPWRVRFLDGRGAPAEAEFPYLFPWNRHVVSGIKFYSGRAVYSKKIAIPADAKGERLMIDLGEVRDIAAVRVDGKPVATLYKAPFACDITRFVPEGADSFELEIEVVNRWANRFLGDEILHDNDSEWVLPRNPKDRWAIKVLPQWVKEGRKSPTGRKAFSTWKHYVVTDPMLDSGLLGPVILRFGRTQ